MDSLLSEMDFETLGSGEFLASPDAVRNVIGNDKVYVLDVRTDVEASHLQYPFAMHIPLDALPRRVEEVPDDRMVIVFAGTPFQAAVGYYYLRQAGLDEVKTYVAGSEALATALKPSPLYLNQ